MNYGDELKSVLTFNYICIYLYDWLYIPGQHLIENL